MRKVERFAFTLAYVVLSCAIMASESKSDRSKQVVVDQTCVEVILMLERISTEFNAMVGLKDRPIAAINHTSRLLFVAKRLKILRSGVAMGDRLISC